MVRQVGKTKLEIGMRMSKSPRFADANRPPFSKGVIDFRADANRSPFSQGVIDFRADANRSPFSKSLGFTLIEVLVVLIIVAIITAIAVLAFGQFGRGRREQMIAQQFTRVITVAQQQAILTPEILGLGISASGYQFYQYEVSLITNKGVWKTLGNNVLSNPKAFKNVFQVDVKSVAAFSLPQDNNGTKPAILFLSSGYVTPFVLQLQGDSHIFLITVKNNGVTKMETQTRAKASP